MDVFFILMSKLYQLLSVLLIIGSLCMSGCATITKGSSDSVQVSTVNCGTSVPCKATNKKGSWNFTAPGAVRFNKSDEAMTIECQHKGDSLVQSLVPTRSGMEWGNVLFGGLIGAGVDSATDAHWDMPDSVTVDCGSGK